MKKLSKLSCFSTEADDEHIKYSRSHNQSPYLCHKPYISASNECVYDPSNRSSKHLSSFCNNEQDDNENCDIKMKRLDKNISGICKETQSSPKNLLPTYPKVESKAGSTKETRFLGNDGSYMPANKSEKQDDYRSSNDSLCSEEYRNLLKSVATSNPQTYQHIQNDPLNNTSKNKPTKPSKKDCRRRRENSQTKKPSLDNISKIKHPLMDESTDEEIESILTSRIKSICVNRNTEIEQKTNNPSSPSENKLLKPVPIKEYYASKRIEKKLGTLKCVSSTRCSVSQASNKPRVGVSKNLCYEGYTLKTPQYAAASQLISSNDQNLCMKQTFETFKPKIRPITCDASTQETLRLHHFTPSNDYGIQISSVPRRRSGHPSLRRSSINLRSDNRHHSSTGNPNIRRQNI